MERSRSEEEMVKYGRHIRVHPEFVNMVREMKVTLAVNEGRRYSDKDITKMICDRMKSTAPADFWRFKWK